jgi:hypothetical protein
MATAGESAEISDAQAALYLIDEVWSYYYAAALRAAALLGVADHLASGPRTMAELAAATGVRGEFLIRVLRLLTTRGVFREDPGGSFHLTPQAQALRTDAPFSARAGVIMVTEDVFWRPAADLLPTLRGDGPAFDRIFGMPMFDYVAANPEAGDVFHRGMSSVTEVTSSACARAYDFPRSGTVVDVGGGFGGWLVYVLRGNPGLHGILFDQEHVLAGHRLGEVGAGDRWELLPGDFFAGLPEGHDIYAMKYILHDWSDTECVRILRNCRNAMAPHGRVLVMDTIISPDNRPHFSKMLDITMLSCLTGRERTADEFGALFSDAGLRVTRIVATESPLSIIEGIIA